MTVLPKRLPNATTVVITCGSVTGVTITSSSGILCTGEKKCMPSTRSGRDDAVAMRSIGIVLVFEATIASGGSSGSTAATTDRLMSRSSNTASITSCTLANPV